MLPSKTRPAAQAQQVRMFLGAVLGDNLHAKRVESLANATLGVMRSASLAVSVIGQALAQARALSPKHAIKQVDRLLSNEGIDVWAVFAFWVPEVVGPRKTVVVAMDWTDYDKDGQTTLVLSLVTSHGRATPLLWLTIHKDELTDARNDYEDACLTRLSEVLPEGVAVTILADRGFADTKLFTFLQRLGFDYVIRFKSNVQVTAADGESRSAADWVGNGGRARKLRDARVTAAQVRVGAVVCVQAKGMKEGGCLATSHAAAPAPKIIQYYGKRWTIEPTFRDTKDLRFGMGLSALRIAKPERRDRLLLLSAFAMVLLTLLGAAGESLGLDRHLKVNTVQRRTHSLFRQGCLLYDLIPTMPDHRLQPLLQRFDEMIQQSRTLNAVFSII